MAVFNQNKIEIVILHSTTDYVQNVCSILNQQQSTNLYLSHQLTDPSNSSEVATQLQASHRKNYIIFLDKQLLEILENKKSRKLFATIAGKVKSDQFNVVIVRYQASTCSDDEIREFLNDLDYNDAIVVDLENRDPIRTITAEIDKLSVPREATESEDPGTRYLGGNNSSEIPRGYGSDLNSSHSSSNWNPLNPESILKYQVCSPVAGSGSNHISDTVRFLQPVESYNSFDSNLSSFSSDEFERTDSEYRRWSLNDLNKVKAAAHFPVQHQKSKTLDPNISTSKQIPRELYVNIPDKGAHSNTPFANTDRSVSTDTRNDSTDPHSNPEQGTNSDSALDDLSVAMKNMNHGNSDPIPFQSNVTSYVRQGHQSTMQEMISSNKMCIFCGRVKGDFSVRLGNVPSPYTSPSSFTHISSGPEAMPYYCGNCYNGNSFMYSREIPQHHHPVHDQSPQANKPLDGSFNMSNVPQTLQNSMQKSWEEGKRLNNSFHAVPQQQGLGQNYTQRPTNTNFPNNHQMQGNQAHTWNQNSTLYERVNSEPPHFAQRLNQPQQTFSTYPNLYDNRVMGPQQQLNDVNNGLQLRPEILQMQRQQQQPPFNRNISAGSFSSSDTNNTRPQIRGLGSGQSFPSNQIPSTYLSSRQNSNSRPMFFIPGPQSDEVGPSGGRAYPVPNINEAAGGASAADADGDIPLMGLSKYVMDYIQNSMDFASSQFNWETLADLHGWSFGMIHQLKQKWQKRQIESPFIELLGTGQFQNYTIRQLKDDLIKIPRKDILEKLKEFEDNGILVIK